MFCCRSLLALPAGNRYDIVTLVCHAHADTRTPSTINHQPSKKVQGAISSPFQSQHFPLAVRTSNPLTTPTNLSAANSGSNNLPSRLFSVAAQNSLESPVLTVPGCNATAMAASPALAFSQRSKVLAREFTAALLAR